MLVPADKLKLAIVIQFRAQGKDDALYLEINEPVTGSFNLAELTQHLSRVIELAKGTHGPR